MPKAPLFIPKGSLVEITARTVGGRMLFRPTRELTDRVHGVIGRALSMFDVGLHAFTWMSNHAHYQARVRDAEHACGFIAHVNRNTSMLAKRLTGWEGPVWTHSSIVPIVDDDAAFHRLRYILSNGVKEGLVESPLDWPGPSGARALLDEAPIPAIWRSTADGSESMHPIHVTPLPAWQRHPRPHRRRLVESLLHEIKEEGARQRQGAPPLGIARLRAQDPLATHELEAHDRAAPIVHASSEAARREFLAERRAFSAHFRNSSRERRNENPAPLYPPNGLPSLAP